MSKPIILATDQNVTGSWADLNGEMAVGGIESINLWLDVTINDSTGVQFRILNILESEGDEHDYLSYSQAGGVTSTFVQCYQLQDATQKTLIHHEIFGTVPFCKVQVKALVVGDTAARINKATATIE